MYKTKRFWVALLLVILSLYIAFRGIELEKLVGALTHINLAYAPVAVVVFWLSFGSRVFRWQLLYTPNRMRSSKVLATLSIGYFLSNITPLRAGDVVRAYLLAKAENVPVARSLSSVVVERMMDAVTIVFFLLILLAIIPHIPDEARLGGAIIGIPGVVLLIGLALFSLNRERAVPLLRRFTARLGFLQRESVWNALERLIDGFAVLHSWRPLAGVIGWSLVIWFFAAVLNWVIMGSMGISLGLDAAALVLVATSLGVTIFPTPGQLGVFDATAQQTLVLVYHLDPSQALAYALVSHAYVYVWLMILGGLFMWREGISYAQLQRVPANVQAPSPTPLP